MPPGLLYCETVAASRAGVLLAVMIMLETFGS